MEEEAGWDRRVGLGRAIRGPLRGCPSSGHDPLGYAGVTSRVDPLDFGGYRGVYC